MPGFAARDTPLQPRWTGLLAATLQTKTTRGYSLEARTHVNEGHGYIVSRSMTRRKRAGLVPLRGKPRKRDWVLTREQIRPNPKSSSPPLIH